MSIVSRLLLPACALALAACGGGAADAAGAAGAVDPGVVTADSALVAVLADVHVLDARRDLVRDSLAFGAAAADSLAALRAAVLARHGYDAARLAAALDALDADPMRLALTWASVQDSVDARLRAQDTPASGLTPPVVPAGDAPPP